MHRLLLGQVQAQGHGLQPEGEQAPHGVIHLGRQLLQHAVDAPEQGHLLLAGHLLQVMPELRDLQAEWL